MSSKRLDGVLFQVHPQDHLPAHLHAYYAETVAIVEFFANGTVRLAQRKDRLIPRDAKASDVRKILNAAAAHAQTLLGLWEKMQNEN